MLRAAIVGLGGIGNRHAQVYQAHERVEIVAVCDLIQEKADKAAQAYGARAFYSVPEMLASDVKFDFASVTTAGVENGGDHHQPTMQLLEAGIPVLGEKPISNEIPKAREMVAKAKEKNLAYGVNLNHRFTPAAAMAKKWVDEGKLGELNMIRMMMWINNPNESSPHFHIRALHPHSIDVMRYFCGDVVKVQAFFKKGKGRKIWSNAQVNMLFASGVVGNLMGSYDGGGPGSPWGLETCEVLGQDAKFVIDDACEALTFQPRGSIESQTYRHPGGMRSFGDTFESRLGKWIEDLENKTPPNQVDGKGEDALKAQLIIEAAVESWDRGTVVDVPQI